MKVLIVLCVLVAVTQANPAFRALRARASGLGNGAAPPGSPQPIPVASLQAQPQQFQAQPQQFQPAASYGQYQQFQQPPAGYRPAPQYQAPQFSFNG